MTIEVAIVADDLTGALDAAAPFARGGRRVVVAIDPGVVDAWRGAADVVAITTSTRDRSAAGAASAVAGAVATLQALEPKILFKKIDSTLRGHVAAETVAMLRAGGLSRAVVCPAVPEQGRVVHGGQVFVHGAPLADWLPAGAAEKLRLAGSLPGLFESVSQAGPDLEITFPDAADATDLGNVARSILGRPGEVLAVGASGLAAALAGPGRVAPPPALDGPVLFVAGSRTRETAAQARALGVADGVAMVAVSEGSGVSFDPTARAVLLASDERAIPPGTPAAAVASWMAAAAERAVAALSPATIVLTGGDTAVAVLRRLGCGLLEILGEIEPGVPVSGARLSGRPVRIVTKAGGFGAPGIFAEILRRAS